MEKQINEMAKELCHAPHCHIKDLPTECYHRCNAYTYAKRSIDAGYRKASDVAREIFEELEKYLITGCTSQWQAVHSIGVGTFAALKKKYTGVENNE